MKKLNTWGLILSILFLVLAGCDTGTGGIDGGGEGGGGGGGGGSVVYTAGAYMSSGGLVPCYWTVTGDEKTRVPLSLPDESAVGNGNSIVLSGSTVYVAGEYASSAGSDPVPCYWIGTGQPQALSVPENNFGRAKSIALAGGTVYVAGYYYPSAGGADKPCYWIGTGDPQNLSVPEDNTGNAYSITVSGTTVYTAGYYEPFSGPGSQTACYWIGTERRDLPGTSGNAFSITVSGGKIYTTGASVPEHGSEAVPCYWIDQGQPQYLPGAGANLLEGNAVSIALAGDTIYIAGWYHTSGVAIPCYWTVTTEDTARKDLNLPLPEGEGGGATEGGANSIAVSGSTIYVGGEYGPSGGDPLPCYWTVTGEDTARVPLPLPGGVTEGAVFSLALAEE